MGEFFSVLAGYLEAHPCLFVFALILIFARTPQYTIARTLEERERRRG